MVDSTTEGKSTIAEIYDYRTQGNPGLPWGIFHVESTIDYFVGFSLIIWELKTKGIFHALPRSVNIEMQRLLFIHNLCWYI